MDNPWKILYTKQGLKDKQIAFKAGYGKKIMEILHNLTFKNFTKNYMDSK